MTLAALVRGQAPRREKAAHDDPARLIRLVPAPRPAPVEDLPPSDAVLHRAVAVADELLRSVRARVVISGGVVEASLETLLASLRTSDVLLLPFFNPGGGPVEPAEKAVRVCALAMKIGMELTYPHERLLRLGMAASLHEAGVGRIHGDEAKVVQSLGPRYAEVAGVLVTLRERTRGTGRSADVDETEIREHAHIAALAGLIENLVRRRPVQAGLGHSEAIKEVLKRERGTYPDKILKVLIRILATLPVGSLVRLNTGEIGRVVAKNDGFPLRPSVMILVRQGKRLHEPATVDLSQHPFLHIQGFVTEETLDRETEERGR
jgi:hypothetical protein